jgi:hypothetical protein
MFPVFAIAVCLKDTFRSISSESKRILKIESHINKKQGSLEE